MLDAVQMSKALTPMVLSKHLACRWNCVHVMVKKGEVQKNQIIDSMLSESKAVTGASRCGAQVLSVVQQYWTHLVHGQASVAVHFP